MSMKNLARGLIVVLLPLMCLVVDFTTRPVQSAARPTQQAPEDPTFEKTVLPFLSANCYVCHNEKLKSGDLNLESYQTAASVAQDRGKWEQLAQRLSKGEMPPKGMPRPDEAEIKVVTSWVEKELERADVSAAPDPGHVTARRLNRSEYNNTVRDLLGVDVRPADDFPQDDSGYGFDNIGDVLSISPVLVEKYLRAAENVARTALYGISPLKPTMSRYKSPGRNIIQSNTPLYDYDLTGLSLPNALHVTHRFPADGQYTIRVYLGGTRPAGSEPMQVGLWIDGQQVQTRALEAEGIASFSDDRQDFGGRALEFRTKLTAGDHWMAASFLRMYEGLPRDYQGPNPAPLKEPNSPARVVELKKIAAGRREPKVAVNDARISSFEIGGPYDQAKGPAIESLKKIYTCGHLDGHHHAGCARKIVTNLARRAYRRPPAPHEINQLVNLYSTARAAGDSFADGLSVAIQAMLVSPNFLFRIEKEQPAAHAGEAHLINQYELASRLSYFLWSSMPDDELLRCADKGILRRPDVLAAQMQRMLKDSKSAALVENFGGQWLELRKLDSVKPDRQRFPEFEEYLRMSMRRETQMFFETVMREDRSILDFLDGKYTFLNERLAKFYKIQGVKGPEFRKVDLTATSHRSGILTQASILTVSSYATRTSPVLRGKWILENLLNTPPPPPPPDVPNLDAEHVGETVSLRQQLEQHRQNTTCASCHARMDPLGFGFENYDAVGSWRTLDGKFPIDSSGSLPGGRKFNGPEELKAILKTDRDAFAKGLTEKLLTYALGRGLESYDKRTVKEIGAHLSEADYRFSHLILEIVKSMPFQMTRGDQFRR